METDLEFRTDNPDATESLATVLTNYCKRVNGQAIVEAAEKTLVDAVFAGLDARFVAYMAVSKRHHGVQFYSSRGCPNYGQDAFPHAALGKLLNIQSGGGFVARPMRQVLDCRDLDGLLFGGAPNNRFEQAIVSTLPIPGEDLIFLLFVGFNTALVETEDTLEFLDAMLNVANVARRSDASNKGFKSEHERVVRAKQEWQCSVDVLPQLICVVDKYGVVVRANRTVEQLGLGKVTDVRGRFVWDLLTQLGVTNGKREGDPIVEWCAQVREHWDTHWQTAVECGGVDWVVHSCTRDALYCIAVNRVDMSTPYSNGVEAHVVLVLDDVSRSPKHNLGVQDVSSTPGTAVAKEAIGVETVDRLNEEALPGELLDAQEEERSRLALELHDGLGQMLTMMKLQCDCVLDELNNSTHMIDPASRIKVLRKCLADSIEEVHRVSMNLRPAMLGDLGLGPTLKWFFRECKKSNLAFEISADIEIDEDVLNPELETEIFRVTQEAISNIAKHAEASQVRYRLQAKGSQVKLVIEDDGIGFDAGQLKLDGAGFRNMRKRVTRTGGHFAVESVPNEGVRLFADWQFQ